MLKARKKIMQLIYTTGNEIWSEISSKIQLMYLFYISCKRTRWPLFHACAYGHRACARARSFASLHYVGIPGFI